MKSQLIRKTIDFIEIVRFLCSVKSWSTIKDQKFRIKHLENKRSKEQDRIEILRNSVALLKEQRKGLEEANKILLDNGGISIEARRESTEKKMGWLDTPRRMVREEIRSNVYHELNSEKGLI